MDSFEVTCILPIDPSTVYRDWMSSKGHTLFTGGVAKIDSTIGGKFSAWDGYIWGENLELEIGKRIVQSWNTSNFPDGAAPSKIEVKFEADPEGCKITLIHTEIQQVKEQSTSKVGTITIFRR